jgi:hypothetical protein
MALLARNWLWIRFSIAGLTFGRPHDPIQRHRLRHAFEFVVAALLGHEQAGDLALTRAVTTTAPGSASACARANSAGER